MLLFSAEASRLNADRKPKSHFNVNSRETVVFTLWLETVEVCVMSCSLIDKIISCSLRAAAHTRSWKILFVILAKADCPSSLFPEPEFPRMLTGRDFSHVIIVYFIGGD